jgi:hypothetical protein
MSLRTILLTTAAVALLSINGSGVAFAKNGADDQQTDQADSHLEDSVPDAEDAPGDVANEPEVEDAPENEVEDSPGVDDAPENEVEDTPGTDDDSGTEVEDPSGEVEDEPATPETEPADGQDDDAPPPAIPVI